VLQFSVPTWGCALTEDGAHYDDYNGMFEVDLWEEGKGFILDLTHEYNYELDPEREALVPALSEMSEIIFWMRVTHYSARWITLCEQRGRTRGYSQTAASLSS